MSANAIMIGSQTEALMSAQCLTKSPEVITRQGDGDNQVVSVVDHSEQIKSEAFSDGMDLHMTGMNVCLEENEGEDAAILGIQV